MDELQSILDKIRNEVAADLAQCAEWFSTIVDTRDSEEDIAVSDFVQKVFSWYSAGGIKTRLLYEFLLPTMDIGASATFLQNFSSFVSHDLLDDGAFLIRWMVTDPTMEPRTFGNRTIMVSRNRYNPDGSIRMKEVSEADLHSMPEVVYDSMNGRQDANLLIAAMDEMERRYMAKYSTP
jgi:hypothetical protein